QIDRLNRELSGLEGRLHRAIRTRLSQAGERLASLARSLNNVSPLTVLERGYAVARTPEGVALTQKTQFSKGMKINLLFHDFEVDSEVLSEPRDASLK
ncbi:MAG: exodeoxyribonuclease VII large subunit, partial [Wenzhouxiangella sp.]